MEAIHPTALISSGAVIGKETVIGPYSIVGPHVILGAHNKIGPHVVIDGHTTIGDENMIYQFASLGAAPQDLKYGGEESTLVIGNKNTIREYVTLQRGTQHGGMKTEIGDENLFMVSSHVAHDVKLGSRNVVANCAAIAGHVVVGNRVTIGGLVGIHQFVRIGDLAILSGGTMATQDIPPYCIAQGDRARLVGINKVGLERAGVAHEEYLALKKVFRLLFFAVGGLQQKLESLENAGVASDYVQQFLTFVKGSERGLASARKGADA